MHTCSAQLGLCRALRAGVLLYFPAGMLAEAAVGLQVWMAPNYVRALWKVLVAECPLFKCFIMEVRCWACSGGVVLQWRRGAPALAVALPPCGTAAAAGLPCPPQQNLMGPPLHGCAWG